MPLPRFLLCSLVAILLCLSPLRGAQPATVKFDIPAGPASQTLKLFGEQAAKEVLFGADAVDRVRTNAVKGEMTPEAAIAELLANTSLRAERDPASGAFTIEAERPNESGATENTRVAPSAETTGDDNKVVVMSAFQVTDSAKDTRFVAAESTSGGRIRIDNFSTPASINVLTSELMVTIGADRIIDVAKYSSGVSEGNIPGALERTMIRGFQTDGATVDGFYQGSQPQSNLDPALIDRVEIVMGPNAILSPNGSPGGTINTISKRPLFKSEGSWSVKGDTNGQARTVLDVTGPVPGHPNAAARFITAVDQSENYWDHNFKHSQLYEPSFTYRFSPETQLTLIGEIYRSRFNNIVGALIDPTVGTNDKLRLWPGLPWDWNPAERDETRYDNVDNLEAFFTTVLWRKLSIRVGGRFLYDSFQNLQLNPGLTAKGGKYDPNTGFWIGGVGPQPTTLLTRAGFYRFGQKYFETLQNDYAWTQAFGPANTTTMVGYTLEGTSQRNYQKNASRGSYDLFHPVYGLPIIYTPLVSNSLARTHSMQMYGYERVGFIDDRIVLTAGGARYETTPDLKNFSTHTYDKVNAATTTKNYGIVVKPVSSVSLYYSYSSNAVPNSDTRALAASSVPPFSEGVQKEFGIKFQLLDPKITASVAHYDISQTNQPTSDPRNNSSPPPPVPFPFQYLDRTSKGNEVQVGASVTKNFDLIGNIAWNKSRDPNGVPTRSAPDHSAALLGNYRFSQGRLRGFGVSLGADYLSKRAGDLPSGYAANSTPAHPIPLQPSFYLPARTLLNGVLTYQRGHWNYVLDLDNLTNEKYFAASLDRTSIITGVPFTARLTVTYKW